jgi:hypothetical protein
MNAAACVASNAAAATRAMPPSFKIRKVDDRERRADLEKQVEAALKYARSRCENRARKPPHALASPKASKVNAESVLAGYGVDVLAAAKLDGGEKTMSVVRASSLVELDKCLRARAEQSIVVSRAPTRATDVHAFLATDEDAMDDDIRDDVAHLYVTYDDPASQHTLAVARVLGLGSGGVSSDKNIDIDVDRPPLLVDRFLSTGLSMFGPGANPVKTPSIVRALLYEACEELARRDGRRVGETFDVVAVRGTLPATAKIASERAADAANGDAKPTAWATRRLKRYSVAIDAPPGVDGSIDAPTRQPVAAAPIVVAAPARARAQPPMHSDSARDLSVDRRATDDAADADASDPVAAAKKALEDAMRALKEAEANAQIAAEKKEAQARAEVVAAAPAVAALPAVVDVELPPPLSSPVEAVANEADEQLKTMRLSLATSRAAHAAADAILSSVNGPDASVTEGPPRAARRASDAFTRADDGAHEKIVADVAAAVGCVLLPSLTPRAKACDATVRGLAGVSVGGGDADAGLLRALRDFAAASAKEKKRAGADGPDVADDFKLSPWKANDATSGGDELKRLASDDAHMLIAACARMKPLGSEEKKKNAAGPHRRLMRFEPRPAAAAAAAPAAKKPRAAAAPVANSDAEVPWDPLVDTDSDADADADVDVARPDAAATAERLADVLDDLYQTSGDAGVLLLASTTRDSAPNTFQGARAGSRHVVNTVAVEHACGAVTGVPMHQLLLQAAEVGLVMDPSGCFVAPNSDSSAAANDESQADTSSPVLGVGVARLRRVGYSVRFAREDDVDALVAVEAQNWGSKSAMRTPRATVLDRVVNNPAGNLVVQSDDGEVKGGVYFQRVNAPDDATVYDWHNKERARLVEGPYVQLMDIHVCQRFSATLGRAVGNELREFVLNVALTMPGVRGVCAVTRTRGYRNKEKVTGVKYEDYVMQSEGKHDRGLLFHTGGGARVLKPVHNWRPADHENDGKGTLILYDLPKLSMARIASAKIAAHRWKTRAMKRAGETKAAAASAAAAAAAALKSTPPASAAASPTSVADFDDAAADDDVPTVFVSLNAGPSSEKISDKISDGFSDAVRAHALAESWSSSDDSN